MMSRKQRRVSRSLEAFPVRTSTSVPIKVIFHSRAAQLNLKLSTAAMSHVPFVAIDANESSAFESRPLVAADPLRTQAKAVAIKPATTSEGEGMAPRRVPSRKNGLPTWIAFPLAVSLSFGLSATLYSLPALPGISDYELAKVSRSLNDAWQIGGIVAWKVSEIGIAWSAGLDCKTWTWNHGIPEPAQQWKTDAYLLQTWTFSASASWPMCPTTLCFTPSTKHQQRLWGQASSSTWFP